MNVDAFVVAEWFIAHNNSVMQLSFADEMSNLKIQKLLYYAQGCCFAYMGKELFQNDIVAWKHGPVVPDVYDKYQKYGRGGINSQDIQKPVLSNEHEILLIKTYNAFAKYSAWELVNMTHMEDPWKMTDFQSVISKLLIKNYFSTHHKDIVVRDDMVENIEQLKEIGKYPSNWDGEGAVAFSDDFIQELIDLISILKIQPDVGATGRGSIDFEFGSIKPHQKYMDFEIFEDQRKVHMFKKDQLDKTIEKEIEMEDINGEIQQF